MCDLRMMEKEACALYILEISNDANPNVYDILFPSPYIKNAMAESVLDLGGVDTVICQVANQYLIRRWINRS